MNTAQKGRSDLKLASLRRDRELVELARGVAFEIVDGLTPTQERGVAALLVEPSIARAARAERRAAEAAARETLAFLGLEDVADAAPSELSYGRQKQVEFARALMQKARLVLLDEPMAGMSEIGRAHV